MMLGRVVGTVEKKGAAGGRSGKLHTNSNHHHLAEDARWRRRRWRAAGAKVDEGGAMRLKKTNALVRARRVRKGSGVVGSLGGVHT